MKNYIHLAPSLPWVISQPSSTSAMTVAFGDLDGDSRKELVVVNPAHTCLSLLSHFEYADVSPGWAAYREPRLVNYFAQPVIGGPKKNAPTWNVGANDQVWCADVDGDGRDEILIFNPDDKWVGLLKWNGVTLESVWQINDQIPGVSGAGNWVIGAADRHFVADLDGDGRDEILVFNPEDNYIGVLRWGGSGLGCSWSAGGQITGGTAGNWVVGSADQHFVADLDGDGRDEIFVFNLEDQWVGVLRLNGPALQCVWMVGGNIPNSSGTGSYPVNGADQYYVADFDGDGKDEIFVYNPNNKWTGAFDWSGSALQWLGGQADGIPAGQGGGPGWYFGPADQHFVADLNGDGKDEIVVFNPDELCVGVFQWDGYRMECPWLIGGQIPATAGGGGWNIGNTDQYFVADLDGDGRDELVVVNPGDQWAGTLRWDGSQMQNTWGVPNSFPYWGMGLLAGGPETPFPYSQLPFVETPLTVYEYVSGKLASTADVRSLYPTWGISDFESMQQSLDQLSNPDYDASAWAAVMSALSQDFVYGYVSDTLEGGCQGDIRFEYTNGAKTSADFLNYENTAQKLAAATPPPPFDFAASDPYGRYQLFSKVALQIASECACVGDVVQLLNVDMSALAGALKDAQMSQLGTVVSNITETVDATVSRTEWWLGQAADALIWGAASVPFGEEVFGINVAISITASMFGSILSSGSGGSGNNPPPPTVMLAECGSQLESFYENTINSNLNDLTAVLQDPVKLPLIYGLVQRAWAWPTNFVAGTFSAQAENTYRTSFYQQLIPMAFQVMVWSNVSRSQPFYVETVGKYPAYENVNAPANAYLSLGAGGGLNNIYMLYQGTGNLSHRSDFKYPGSSLTNDLFQTLGVSPADFFTGSDGWNIPTVTADVNV